MQLSTNYYQLTTKNKIMTVSRRDAIKRAALLLGSTFILPDILKAWESPSILNKSIRFTADQSALIAEIADLIVPTTSTPGAKAAGVPAFIEKMIADCYTKKDQELFFQGLTKLDSDCVEKFGKNFLNLSKEDQIAMLKLAEIDSQVTDKKIKGGDHFWKTIKGLTVTGYFTSEIGATQALRYEPVPGRYDGDVAYKKGDKSFADS